MPAQTNYNVGTSSNGFTIEFWMNPTAFQSGSVLGWATNGVRVERYDYNWTGAGLRCYLTSTGNQFVQTPANVWSSSSWFWTHVAMTFDSAIGQYVLYVNGAPVASTLSAGPIFTTSHTAAPRGATTTLRPTRSVWRAREASSPPREWAA